MTENLDSPCLVQIQQLRKAQNKTLEMYRELYESYIESPNKSYDRSAFGTSFTFSSSSNWSNAA